MEDSQNPFKLLDDENEKMPSVVKSEMESTIGMTKMFSHIIELFIVKAGSTVFTLMGGDSAKEEDK
jgi:hypothetical protein